MRDLNPQSPTSWVNAFTLRHLCKNLHYNISPNLRIQCMVISEVGELQVNRDAMGSLRRVTIQSQALAFPTGYLQVFLGLKNCPLEVCTTSHSLYSTYIHKYKMFLSVFKISPLTQWRQWLPTWAILSLLRGAGIQKGGATLPNLTLLLESCSPN